MKNIGIAALLLLTAMSANVPEKADMKMDRSITIDSLGACQGISYQKGRIFLYGDREVGMIREYKMNKDSLVYQHKEYLLTKDGKDVINHPTGIAYNGTGPVFIGNSIRLNDSGTQWKAVIYCVNWQGLLKTGTLDGNIINTIEDDACIQGTRPEYVKYNHKWYVATADYGNHGNEVRLYDPEALRKAGKTSEKGVLFKKFTCTAWVQNLHWVADKGVLVLIQNQVEGHKWRFTYINLAASVNSGKQEVIKEINIEKPDELEGFSFLGNTSDGIAVTSSKKNNVTFTHTGW
jgi:hypothetical protein